MVINTENNANVEQRVENGSEGEEDEGRKVRRKRGRPGEHITGPSAEQLLLREEDPEVLRLQKELEDKETGKLDGSTPAKMRKVKKEVAEKRDTDEVKDEDYDPNGDESEAESESGYEKNLSAPDEQLYRDLRKIVSECQPKQFKVKRANNNFNLCPVAEYSNGRSSKADGWRDFRRGSKVPSFAAIVGVKRAQEDDIDPRLVKFNGELLTGLPLAWSLPEDVEEMDEHFDGVTDAYRRVLGFSEEELYCNKMFFNSQSGLVKVPKKIPKELRSPKTQVTHNLSMKFRNMDKDSLREELVKRVGDEAPADQRKEGIPDLNLQHDRCRLKFDKNLRRDDFEGLMVIAWHTDDQPVGKVLNFDDNKDIFVTILKDVWMRVTNRSDYKLPFSHHVISRYMSVYERAFAPRLLQQLIDGTVPSMICPHCGKIFTMLVARDKEMYEKHVQLHELGSCGCEDVGKIDTLAGMERHMKLHHSDDKYAQCSVPNCLHVTLKELLDDHVKEMHMVNIVCEECGMVFNDRMEYRKHRESRHKHSNCKLCGERVLSWSMSSHMIKNHRGDPIPCPTCGAKFADENNLKRHKLKVHTAKEKKEFQCPYPECDKAFVTVDALFKHLNNIHFKVYFYVCEFNCPDARYKDESNIRAHYKKRHGQKLHGLNNPTLDAYLKTMTEEERVYHESVLCRSEHYKRLAACNYKRDGITVGRIGRKKTIL